MLGNKNRLAFVLLSQGQITGGGSDTDVVGNHFRLPCKARLVNVDITAQAISTSTTTAAVISVYAGTTNGDTKVAVGTMSDTVPRVDGTLVAAQKHKIYDANQEFCMSENTTSSETIDGLGVVLTFREEEA